MGFGAGKFEDGGTPPWWGLGGRCVGWEEGWFEAVDGNVVGAGADLEEEGMRGAAEDFEGSRVGRGEGWVGRRGADKNKGSLEEGGWDVGGRGVREFVGKEGAGEGRGQVVEELGGIIFGGSGELGR